MKKSLMWCLLGFFLLGSAEWSQAQTTSGTEKAVAALEEQWAQAQNTNSPDLLAPLLADKFVTTSFDGKVTGKAETLAEVKSFVKNSAANSEVKVIVYGDTAIATGIWKAKMKDPSGKIIDLNIQWTDTWVKMASGQWQCVASHGSPAKM
jgi:uncharacterized protein (TIGR02246 family)